MYDRAEAGENVLDELAVKPAEVLRCPFLLTMRQLNHEQPSCRKKLLFYGRESLAASRFEKKSTLSFVTFRNTEHEVLELES